MDCYAIGDTADFAKTVSEFDVYGFAGIVGDFFGVHLNEEYAKTTRFGKRIAQGALSVGFISTAMGTLIGVVLGLLAGYYRRLDNLIMRASLAPTERMAMM
jgi:acyl dehydratase